MKRRISDWISSERVGSDARKLRIAAAQSSAIASLSGHRHRRGSRGGRGAAKGRELRPDRATEDYLSRLPADSARQVGRLLRGRLLLTLWSFLYGLVVAWILLTTVSRPACATAERWTRFRALQTFLYVLQYICSLPLGFPWAVYTGFAREHKYGMATQDSRPGCLDELKALGLG